MARSTVRLGLIGCGGISRMHMRALQDAPAAEVVALADVSTARIDALKADYPGLAGAAVYTDYHDLLASDLDGAIVMTPHALHYEQIRAALEAGKHVLTEKPFVTQPAQARELIDLAKQRGRILMLSYQNPLMAPYRYARQQIAEGALGEIVFYSGQITQNWALAAGSWRMGAHGEGGMLVDTGSHFVDLMLVLTGMKPDLVTALCDNVGQPVDIITGALVRFNGGHVATLAAVGRGPVLWNITIIGTKGTIELTDRDQIRHIGADNYAGWIGTPRHNLVPPEDQRPPATTPDAEFVAALVRNDLNASDAERGLVVAQLTQAIYQSAEQGGMPVPLTSFG